MSEVILRKYRETDFAAVNRVWKECGWLPEKMESTMKEIIGSTRHVLAEVNGSVEAVIMTTDGSLKYQDQELRSNLIDAVTVSLVARKLGLAGKCLAQLLSEEAESGMAVSVLGMFEQGYYNKLGYGTGTYYRQLYFDPADLLIDKDFRIPSRIDHSDYKKVHESRLKRLRPHGGYNVLTPIMTKSEMEFMKKSYGLGYYNAKGELTHHLWINPSNQEYGPFEISWMTYQNYDQFLELIALIRSFNDQVRLVSMTEPAGIQFVDFLKQPMRKRSLTKGSKFQNWINSSPYWQMRILDLSKCLAQTHLDCKPVEFNLQLEDPIKKYLSENARWQGISGKYHLKLGKHCEIEEGLIKGLPLLKAEVGAFSRMWMGVKPASGLAVTDKLEAHEPLLQKLDKAFCLPEPQPEWWY